MQNKSGNAGLTEVETLSSGCWNVFLYVNGRTNLLHTEKDCAYTFITVPNQSREKNTQLKNKLMFIFKISEEQQLMLPLCNDLSFVYNGNFATHVRLVIQIQMMLIRHFSIYYLMVMRNYLIICVELFIVRLTIEINNK